VDKKTLKDIECKTLSPPSKCYTKELRDLAKEWLDYFETLQSKSDYYCGGEINFIRHFFNIKDTITQRKG